MNVTHRTRERPVPGGNEGHRVASVRLKLAPIVFVLFCAVTGTDGVAAPESGPVEQAREILEKEGFQRDPPDLGGGQGNDGDRTEGPSDQETGPETEQSGGVQLGLEFLFGLFTILMWAGVALAAVAALYFLVRVIRQGTGEASPEASTRQEPDEATVKSIDRSGMDQVLARADELAEEGRYTDAIRRMFLDAAGRIERELDVRFSKSDTNREYLDRIREAEEFQELCRVLVDAVDRFYYGGRPCEEADYRRCRQVWKQVQARSGS